MKSTETSEFPGLQLIDVDQLCTLWGVKKSWVYDQVEAGRLPALRLGKQLRFREADLASYLAAAVA
ncbi:MAG: DNA-binding protein [Actinomycetia bacterium]|jgi:excisionase family DNA binding protein|nr:DNA-binding protein [Actinomycetes bacterium]